jgi:hypothetical protein
MHVQPQREHQWLQKLVGDWTSEMEACMGPDQPIIKSKGVESVRCLGELWTLGEGRGEMPDGKPATTLMTLGYDGAKQRFVGTFVGSMMTHMWLYEGTLDAASRVLTLDTEGPDFSGGPKLARYKDVVEIIDDDHRTLSSSVEGADGKFTQFMTAHYYRTK